ncbi:MAG TPA: hypothetical protein VEJ18_04310, partial [Planctomycetota bacterium]|nr:hypothetical protein [Planctomycetota bacterium]
ALCAVSCRDEETSYDLTPGGFPVRWEEEGSTALGYFDKAKAFAWYDDAVTRGAVSHLARYGVPADHTLDVARRWLTYLIDNYRRDNWTGSTNMGEPDKGGWIKVCLYRQGYVEAGGTRPTEVNGWPVPPWSHHTGAQTGRLYYGYIDEAAGLYPALGHEIGHLYFRSPDFEHTWWPPTVARASGTLPRWTYTADQMCLMDRVD